VKAALYKGKLLGLPVKASSTSALTRRGMTQNATKGHGNIHSAAILKMDKFMIADLCNQLPKERDQVLRGKKNIFPCKGSSCEKRRHLRNKHANRDKLRNQLALKQIVREFNGFTQVTQKPT
jgi:hypothetical protein